MNFYRSRPDPNDFSPEEHAWLAESDGLFLFVRKASDTWSSYPRKKLDQDFTFVPASNVPVEVRRKAGQRLGGAQTARMSR